MTEQEMREVQERMAETFVTKESCRNEQIRVNKRLADGDACFTVIKMQLKWIMGGVGTIIALWVGNYFNMLG